MASVPNTTTFTLQNVVSVVGGTSLSAAFANSVDSYFDPAYKGSKNNLLNFRNYNEVVPYVEIVPPQQLLFNSNGDPYDIAYFSISSNVTWTASIYDPASIVNSWGPYSGGPNGTIYFYLAPNQHSYTKPVEIEVTDGVNAWTWGSICQDGTMDTCDYV